MERLRHSDYARLLDFIAELQEPVALADFGSMIVRLTSDLLPGAIIAFDQIDERRDKHFGFATGAFGIDSPLVTLGIQVDRPATEYGYLIPDLERRDTIAGLRPRPFPTRKRSPMS